MTTHEQAQKAAQEALYLKSQPFCLVAGPPESWEDVGCVFLPPQWPDHRSSWRPEARGELHRVCSP